MGRMGDVAGPLRCSWVRNTGDWKEKTGRYLDTREVVIRDRLSA
jgi:hypothetical protein